MRELSELGTLDPLSSEVFPVLQLYAIREPMFPNLKTLGLWSVSGKSVPFIPLFFSPRIIAINIAFIRSDSPAAMVAPMVAALPTLCPNLQEILLGSLPREPMITPAASEMLIANSRNALRTVFVNSPLTEEAYEVIFKHPDLRELSVTIERDTSFPSVVFSNLTRLIINYDNDNDWLRMFHGATFGKLEVVTFFSESEQIGDFLGAFERVALAASFQNTLTRFHFRTSCSWDPDYSSLLRFTRLADLEIGFSCDDGCSSTVDDDIITNLAQAMPKLESLRLGDPPCREIPIGVTVKGLVALASHCPDLGYLRIHFHVASLSTPPVIHGTPPHTVPRRDCGFGNLDVGEIPMPEESVWMVALTLARIFPELECIDCIDENWQKVEDAICLSRQIVDVSGRECHLSTPRSNLSDTPSPGAALGNGD